MFLRTICKGCGQKFQSDTLLQHLRSQNVNCTQYYDNIEIKALRTKHKTLKSKILQYVDSRNEEEDFEEVELPLDILTDMMTDCSDKDSDNSSESNDRLHDKFIIKMKKSSDLADIYCRSCLKCFKNYTILKHLKSPKVQCIKDYHSDEITEMENNSKLRRKMSKSIWSREKRKNDMSYFQRIKQDYTIRRKIELNIFKLTREEFTKHGHGLILKSGISLGCHLWGL